MKRVKTFALSLIAAHSTHCAHANPDHAIPLQDALLSYLSETNRPLPPLEDCFVSFAQLNAQGPEEALVLLQGTDYCGTGGCTLLIFEKQEEDSFTCLNKLSLCRKESIWLAESTQRGWRDIVVEVAGGGVPISLRRITYSDVGYPENPSIQPVFQESEDRLTHLPFRPLKETDTE